MGLLAAAWLTLATAWAVPSQSQEGTWQRLQPESSAHVDGVGDVVVVAADPHDELELRCREDGPAPRRLALFVRSGAVTPAEGPFPPPEPRGTDWRLPAPGIGPGWWALTRTDCALWRWRLTTSPAWLDHVEYEARDPVEVFRALRRGEAFATDAVRRQRLTERADPASTEAWQDYAALRPAGGFLRERGGLHFADDAAATDPADQRTARRHVPAGHRARVQGPAQVTLTARSLGLLSELCLVVDADPDTASCQQVALAERPFGTSRGLDARAPSHAGAPASHLVSWAVFVPEGIHELAFDHDVLVRARVTEVDALTAAAPLPTQVAIVALDTPADAPRLLAVPDPESRPVLVFGSTRALPDALDEAVSWVPPEDLAGRPWWSQAREAQVLVWGRGDAPCRVTLPDGSTWLTVTNRVLHRLVLPLGPVDAGRPPTASGCAMRVRVEGDPTRSADRWIGLQGALGDASSPVVLRFEAAPEGPVQLRVHPAHAAPLTVEVVDELGHAWRWELHPPLDTPTVLDAEGGVWLAATVLPIPTNARQLTVRTSQPAVLRATAPGQPRPAEPTAWGVDDLTTLARRIARATSETERGEALRERAATRWMLGDRRGALQDMELAEDLLGELTEDDALRVGVQRLTAATWASEQAVVWADPAWLPDDVSPSPSTLVDAAATDHVAVARAFRDVATPLPWWIAAARSQTPSTADRLAAYVDVVRWGRTDPDDPALGAVRAWSTWRGVPALQGAESFTATYTPPPIQEEVPWEATWPPEATSDLSDGWKLRLPALPRGAQVEVRCAARQPGAGDGPCRVTQTSLQGRPLASAEVEPWGRITPLELASSAEPSFLHGAGAGPVTLQVRLPDTLAGQTPTSVEALRTLTPTTSTRLLGPTVVRVEAWLPEPLEGALLTARAGADALRSLPLSDQPAELLLPVLDAGEVVFEVTAPPGTLLRVAVRDATDRTVEPGLHRALARALRRGQTEVPSAAPTGALPAFEPTPPPPRPPLPITLLAEIGGGAGGDFDEEPEASNSVNARGLQRLGLLSRPTAAPWWVDARLGVHETSGRATLAEAQVTTEAWWSRPPWRGYGLLQGLLRTPARGDLPTTVRGRLDVAVGVRPRAFVELRGILGLGAATRAGPWRFTMKDEVPGLLWSPYREEHRLWMSGRLELRLHPTPWLRVRAWGRLLANPPGDARAFDAVAGGFDVRAAAPSVLAGVGLWVEHRALDTGRGVPYTSPVLDTWVRGTLWTHADTSVGVAAQLSWLPWFQRLSFDTAIEITWGPARAWDDRRPTSVDAPFAGTWGRPDAWLDAPDAERATSSPR